MRLRQRYLLAGIFWALFLAPVVTYFVLGFVLGGLWLYVFGDNRWPASLEGIILIIASVVFASTAACCILCANRYGRKREIEADVDRPREHRKVLLWGLAPIALITITTVFLWQRSVYQAEATAATQGRAAAFTDLLNARHTIADLGVHRKYGGDFEARIATSGGKAGPYSLFWQVNSKPYGEILSNEDKHIEVGHETGKVKFEVSIDELARRYRDTLLNGGGVVVDEPFELVVTLQPAIDEEDIREWPELERYRWEQGETPLASSMKIDFPVFFRVGKDGAIEHATP